VLATLIRFTGNIDLAEDALQDAVLTAIESWRVDGVPDRPGAWLTTVARNKALDRIRREALRQPKEAAAFRYLTDEEASPTGPSSLNDDRLRLLFTCCHPALSPEAQIALALRTICQLTTAEIARVFLVPEPTVGQRISRAKAKIATARIAYRVPDPHDLPERLPPVLATIYSMFAAGHHAAHGEADARVDLAQESIRLARLLAELMPDENETVGLLALVLATDARRASRFDRNGNLVLLADQNRSLWDHDRIAEASQFVESVLRRRQPGPYQIQAAIACAHGNAATSAETDWADIAELYALLEQHWPTPVVRVNRAVAEAEVHGAQAGLDLLATLQVGSVERWHLYWSTRADFLHRLGDNVAAAAAYRRALGCPCNDTDRRFLESRLDSVNV
jgi:RNA polymerase sigma-70 factor, ECF subfamily